MKIPKNLQRKHFIEYLIELKNRITNYSKLVELVDKTYQTIQKYLELANQKTIAIRR